MAQAAAGRNQMQQYTLVPQNTTAGSQAIPLPPGQPVTVGRMQVDARDVRISRQHATVLQVDAAAGGGVTLTAQKPTFLSVQGGVPLLLQPGQSKQMHVGDTMYLLKAGGSFNAGFTLQEQQRVQQQHQPPAAAPSPAGPVDSSQGTTATEEPEPKRRKSDCFAAAAAPASAGPAAVGGAAGGAAATGHCAAAAAAAAAGCFSETIAAAAQAGDPAPISQQQQQQQLFAGVVLLDWDGRHTHLALTKAAQEGASINQTLGATTTHVIARHELTAAEASRRLQAQAHKQQQQQQRQRHSPAAKRLSMSPQQKTSPQQQKQRQEGGPASCEQLLPPGLQFVTVSWLTSGLKAKQRLLEAQFHIGLQQQLQRTPSGAHLRLPLPATRPGEPQAAAVTPAAATTAAAAVAATGGGGDAATGAETADAGGPAGSPSSKQQQQQQGSSAEKVQRRAHKQQFLVPGPDEICPAGVPWGSGNRWIEPWDDTTALEAMERLMAHWHQTTAKHPRSPAAAAAATPGSTRSSAGSRRRLSDAEDEDAQVLPFQQQQQQQRRRRRLGGDDEGVGGSSASPCEHVACSQQTFCLVEEMERLKRNYHGRTDQFRIKAASRAILELERLQQPILGPQDIELLPIGDKSKAKLQEILATGRLRCNELVEATEQHRTLQLFMTVWGVAEATAHKWWLEGFRSLQDVRNRAAGLTAIQQMGLKYYEDFEGRIPRAEVSEAVDIIRDTTLDVLQDMTGKPRSELDHLLHVRALGSHVRGKLDAGDIDMLLAPGPAAEEVAPGPLAAGLLQRLKDMGFVPEGLSMDHRGATLESAERVSWMGVWRGPSSPCHRRLDIKAYQRTALPYAVLYFASGESCSRALRYWCNKPPPHAANLAAAIHPAANSFHLGDSGLYVVYNPTLAAAAAGSPAGSRRKRGRFGLTAAAAAAGDYDGALGAFAGAADAPAGDDDPGVTAAQAADIHVVTKYGDSPTGPDGRVECSSEADIFKVLGLTYVPPHLRTWY